MSIVTAAIVKSTKAWTRAKKERQAQANLLVEGRDAVGRGRGLFSLAEFSSGELVCPIQGRRDRSENLTAEESLNAVSDARAGYVIVPDVKSVGWHRANHSCIPNAALTVHRGISAIKHIAIGQEVTVDYGWHFSERAEILCCCGEQACLGTIGVTRSADIPNRIAHYMKHRSFDAFAGFVEAMEAVGYDLSPYLDRRLLDELYTWVAKHQYLYG